MKFTFYIPAVCLAFIMSVSASAQEEFMGGSGGGSAGTALSVTIEDPVTVGMYSGGGGKGDTKVYMINAVENPNQRGVYIGGAGRGDTSMSRWLSLYEPNVAPLYRGGQGRGDTVSSSFNVMRNPAGNELYRGGKGRGDIVHQQHIALQNGTASSIYAGGNGRGDISTQQMIPLQAGVSPRFAGGPGRGDHSFFNETTLIDVSNQRRINIEVEPITEFFKVQVRPNPAPNYFTISINSSGEDNLRIRVTDISGRIVYENKLQPGSQHMQIGDNWRNGVYFMEVIQGSERKVLRLLKLQ